MPRTLFKSIYVQHFHPFSYLFFNVGINDISSDKSNYEGRWWMEKLTVGSEDIFGVVSAVIGDCVAVSRRLSIELLEEPSSWASSVRNILHDSSLEECSYSRTVICGAKGVGKSTCVRYMVNKLLSKTDYVAVIDCDLGQPEFTVPGLLSLHIISNPILSPTHMHLSQPILSYFIGDITTKNEPEFFAKTLSALVSKYKKIQQEYLEIRTQNQIQIENEKNSFSALEKKKIIMKMVPLPLVVNTDGNVRYMGAEILSAIMELVRPSHVLHISSEKDRDLPAIVTLRSARSGGGGGSTYDDDTCNNNSSNNNNSNNNNGNSNSCNSNNNSNNYSNNKKNNSSKNDSNDTTTINNNTSNIHSNNNISCKVFTLEPGRLKASKIASVDLRTLR